MNCTGRCAIWRNLDVLGGIVRCNVLSISIACYLLLFYYCTYYSLSDRKVQNPFCSVRFGRLDPVWVGLAVESFWGFQNPAKR